MAYKIITYSTFKFLSPLKKFFDILDILVSDKFLKEKHTKI